MHDKFVLTSQIIKLTGKCLMIDHCHKHCNAISMHPNNISLSVLGYAQNQNAHSNNIGQLRCEVEKIFNQRYSMIPCISRCITFLVIL